jgi:hypothetical protein
VRYSALMTDERPPQLLGARVATHPSNLIPGIPRFVFSVPEGWVVDAAPGALCAVRRPDDADGFWANAIIRHDSIPIEVDFERAAKATWAKLKREVPDAHDVGERLMRFGSRVVYTRGVEMIGPEGRRIAQLQALFFAPVTDGGKVVDFFQIVGTTTADENTPNDMDAFIEIIASFRFV